MRTAPALTLQAILAIGVEAAAVYAWYYLGYLIKPEGGPWLPLDFFGFAVLIWYLFAAPKASYRLGGWRLVLFKLAFFAVAVLSFYWAEGWIVAAIFALVALFHIGLARRLRVL